MLTGKARNLFISRLARSCLDFCLLWKLKS